MFRNTSQSANSHLHPEHNISNFSFFVIAFLLALTYYVGRRDNDDKNVCIFILSVVCLLPSVFVLFIFVAAFGLVRYNDYHICLHKTEVLFITVAFQ